MDHNILIEGDEIHKKINEIPDGKSVCFIFGAGASYGYSPSVTSQPPTVTDLFSDNNYIVSEVIHKSQHDFILGFRDFLTKALKRYNNDLEKYLSDLYNKNESDDSFSSLLIYLQDVFYLASDRVDDKNNSYKDLINSMLSMRGMLPWSCLSFNYDTLLEQSYILAQRDRGRDFKNIESYLKNPKIIKIHGSVNFRYTLKNQHNNSQKSEKEIFGLMMDGKKDIGEGVSVMNPKEKSSFIKPFYDQGVIQEGGHRRMYDFYNFPLMMIPIHGTKRSENEFFLKMTAEAKSEIEKASLVIAIGYNFGDELFTKELSDINLSEKELILVGTNKLVEDHKNHPCYKSASMFWKIDKIKIFNGAGFTAFVDAII